MRKSIYGLVALTALALSSCDESARLAKDIQGSWTGTPQTISNTASATGVVTAVDTYDFQLDEGTDGGTVTLTSMISSTGPISGAEGLELPFELSASARATATGTWQAVDDDEIAISVNLPSISVVVDPDAVMASMNPLSGGTTPTVDPIRPQLAEQLTLSLNPIVRAHFAALRHLDDVKVKGALLRFEINDMDHTMSRN